MDPSRVFVKDVKRLIIKVGTSVVTRSDGRLAVGRVGALVEQIKELISNGYQVIMVTSGAVSLGGQRLSYRKLVNSSFADLQYLRDDLDGKACAAVGQNSLMALYDFLFGQLDMTSSQFLVTDGDFRDEDFRMQLNETVEHLLAIKAIPIFNENDAESSGILLDNDSLSVLLALEMKADLVVFLSDVEGLYSCPPSEPMSKLIHTYIREIHDGEISFGDESIVGLGGMSVKVKSAIKAAYAGIPVVITSGFSPRNIMRVLQGECVGTLFHQDAHLWVPVKEVGAQEMAITARESSRHLQALSSEGRKKILLDVADALEANEELITVENEADVTAAEQSGLEKSLIAGLALKPGKIRSLADSIRVLAYMEDPIGHILKRTELVDGLVLDMTSSPLGVILIIFEARPEVLVQVASLAIRSGNGLLLKGGREAMRSNAILHKVITAAIPETVGGELIGLVTSRKEVPDLLKLDDVIDLVVLRGSNKLVTQIKESTKIPVLVHADNICNIYVDKSADMEMAKRIVLDAKVDHPAASNAMEIILVHQDLVWTGGLNDIVVQLCKGGVRLCSGPRASKELSIIPEAHSFHHDYNSIACTIEIVNDVHSAIDYIHEHGRAHTDCIITEDLKVAEVFLRQVDSAAVFHNASTRFCDGARFGLGAEVAKSTSRIHARGPVGVEGLLTTKWLLRGNGQAVNGDKAVIYTHKDITL